MSTSAASVKGLEGVVAAHTRLSDVRGDSGQLIYCGYDINELANKVSYEEVVHLLHHNHLPNRKELADYERAIAEKIDAESRSLLKQRFNYPVFLYEAEHVGITATGEARTSSAETRGILVPLECASRRSKKPG